MLILIIIASIIVIRLIDYVLARVIGFVKFSDSEWFYKNSLIAEIIKDVENKIKYGR